MGESKNSTQPRIKRNRGMRKVAEANADHSTAQDTAARGHRSAAAPRTWRSKYTDTHKSEPDRQSAKKTRPSSHRSRSASGNDMLFYGSGCGRMPRAQLAAISARVSRGIISILTYPARISFGV